MVKGLEPTAIPDAYVISKNEFDMDVPATERQTDRFGLFKWAKIIKFQIYNIIKFIIKYYKILLIIN